MSKCELSADVYMEGDDSSETLNWIYLHYKNYRLGLRKDTWKY